MTLKFIDKQQNPHLGHFDYHFAGKIYGIHFYLPVNNGRS